MAQQLREKLKSNRGVSLLYALMFMLVATMVAVAIVSAAISAIERVNNDKIRQQNYLALTSAGQLIEDCLTNANFSCQVTAEYDLGATTPKSVAVATTDGTLKSQIQKSMEVATGAEGVDGSVHAVASEAHGEFTISVPDSVSAGDLAGSSVKVQYSMQPWYQDETISAGPSSSYKIAAMLSLEDSDQKLYMVATARRDPEASASDTTKVERVRWTDVTLSTNSEVLQ